MDEKKNGSQVLETTGTALSAVTNISTSSTIYQGESYKRAEEDAVNMVVEMTRLSGGLHMRSLAELSDEVVRTMRNIVESVNVPAQHGGHNLGWPKPKTISAVQAAMLVFEYERIRMVCTKETIGKNAEGVLAVYIDTGKDVGIYREIGDGQIDEWCSEIAGAVDNKWKFDFTKKLHDMASRAEYRVQECDDANLIFIDGAKLTLWEWYQRDGRATGHGL